MRKLLGFAGGSCLGLVLLASQAYAIDTVTVVRLTDSLVLITITGTVAGSTIEWEGAGTSPPTAITTNYAGTSSIVPGNCRGTVSDGIMTIPDVEVESCTPELASVGVTGQTISYAADDDGDYQVGVEWPLPRFTDNGDGTVADNLTGLTWLQKFKCPSPGPFPTWQGALDLVAELNASGTMNGNDCMDTSNEGSHQTDWRLPNVKELSSLIDWGATNPALPPNPFDLVVPQLYWSSTTDNGNPGNRAWMVNMLSGDTRSYNKSQADGKRVSAVRGGQVNN